MNLIDKMQTWYHDSRFYCLHQSSKVEILYQAVFFMAFCCSYTYLVASTTMIDVSKIQFLAKIGIAGAALVAVWRCGHFILEKPRNIFIPILILIIPAVFWRVRGDGYFLLVSFYMLAAWNIPFRRIGITAILLQLLVLAYAAYASTHGMIPNLTRNIDLFYSGDKIYTIYLYGTKHSTDMAAYFFWMMAIYLWIRDRKITWPELVLWGIFIPFLYRHTGAFTNFLGQSLLLIIAVIYKVYGQWSFFKSRKFPKLQKENEIMPERNNKWKRVFIQLIAVLLIFSFIIAAAVMIYLSWHYDGNDPFYIKLDAMLHTRLSLGKKGFIEHPVHWIAENYTMVGTGGYAEGTALANYNFLDSSYLYLLLHEGMLPFIWFLAVMTWNQWKQWRNKYIFGMLLLLAAAAVCMEEHHIKDLGFNVFLLLPLTCKLEKSDRQKSERERL